MGQARAAPPSPAIVIIFELKKQAKRSNKNRNNSISACHVVRSQCGKSRTMFAADIYWWFLPCFGHKVWFLFSDGVKSLYCWIIELYGSGVVVEDVVAQWIRFFSLMFWTESPQSEGAHWKNNYELLTRFDVEVFRPRYFNSFCLHSKSEPRIGNLSTIVSVR